jgi:hypothetical protein
MRRVAQPDADLLLLLDAGMAYQIDQTVTVPYDGEYFNKCAAYEGQAIANAINAGRAALVARHYGDGLLLDVGVGSGEFVKTRPNTLGYDVNPVAIKWLKEMRRWRDIAWTQWPACTFWDVIEHVQVPEEYFVNMRSGAYLFTSLPIFGDLTRIRESKHYRPNEHLYYWTQEGFVRWMAWHGFSLLDVDDFETRAGREAILSFAFRKR